MLKPVNAYQHEPPIIFCLCGPTASGKSTVGQALRARESSLLVSISTTTRAPRDGETDGTDYYFVSREEFERRIAAGNFIEHATFGNERYGTEKLNFDRASREKVDLLLTVDVQGVDALKKLYPDRVVVVFIFPPSLAVLRERLSARGTEDAREIARRLDVAGKEIATLRIPGFSDYLVINDHLDPTVLRLQTIVAAERQRFSRMSAASLNTLLP